MPIPESMNTPQVDDEYHWSTSSSDVEAEAEAEAGGSALHGLTLVTRKKCQGIATHSRW